MTVQTTLVPGVAWPYKAASSTHHYRRGDSGAAPKLSCTQVADIRKRRAEGASYILLQGIFKTSRSTISAVVRRVGTYATF